MVVGDSESVIREIEAFVADLPADVPEPDTVLATVLFTDLVGSTAKAAELGDRRWRELLERHHAAVRSRRPSLCQSSDAATPREDDIEFGRHA